MQTVALLKPKSIQLGSFNDPGGIGPYLVVINWGDGSTLGAFPIGHVGSLGSRTHTFTATGLLAGTIYVVDRAGDVSNFATLSILSPAAPLATIVVNTTKDMMDPVGSPAVSLRDAVARADAALGPVNILFSPSVFASERTITLAQGALDLRENHFGEITIVGPAAGVIVNAGDIIAGFSIDHSITVSFSDLTIIDGSEGGVINNGTATLVRSTLTGDGSIGHAIGLDNAGTASLISSVVLHNIGNVDAGGIRNKGKLTLTDSTVEGNVGQTGGGILNQGVLTLVRSTLSGNTGTFRGGAIDNYGLLSIVDATLTGNTSDSGGAIENYGGGIASISDTTISGNTAYSDGGIADSGILVLANTVIAGNKSSDTPSFDISAYVSTETPVTSLGHNFIGTSSASIPWTPTDSVGTTANPLDPKLSPLGYHGGLTQTMIPLPGSPLLGAGSAALIPAGIITDQRGLPRVIGGAVDIGAVEINQAGPFGGTATPFGRIQAENFDFGGQGVGYYNPGNVNRGGLYRPADGIGAIPTIAGGGYFVGWTLPGESLNDTVAVNSTGTHLLQLMIDSVGSSGAAGNFDWFEAIQIG